MPSPGRYAGPFLVIFAVEIENDVDGSTTKFYPINPFFCFSFFLQLGKKNEQ